MEFCSLTLYEIFPYLLWKVWASSMFLTAVGPRSPPMQDDNRTESRASGTQIGEWWLVQDGRRDMWS